MESTEIAESMKDTDRWVAIYIAVLAVLLSICSVGGGNSTKDATRTNIQASDTWAFYPGEISAPNDLQVAAYALQLRLGEAGLSEATRKQIEEQIAAYKAEIDHLETDVQKAKAKKNWWSKPKNLKKIATQR